MFEAYTYISGFALCHLLTHTILLAKVETDILVNLNTFLVNFVYNIVTCVMLGEVNDMCKSGRYDFVWTAN